MNGGELVASVLQAQGVERLFTLVGGHISPILVAAKARGIQIVDTRHEATAVFAADATARLTGRPGVAAVTAGPGVTNTLTAIKNAQMAQSPVVLIGGAAPTALQGRGALQDIDQMSVVRP
ncbi:MAG TPA: thiamine pyrophosphate-binding protein, partial [Caldilineaceae bacterium]|nr:thiamine pyrophosphate-binding protein [Caldilineaceae bacterium]